MAISKTNSKRFRFLIGEIIYWSIAASLIFFIFSNRHYDIEIRKNLSFLLFLLSITNAQLSNRILIPHVLFRGKRKLFLYLMFFLFLFSLWLISIAVFLITFYNSITLPDTILPSLEDVIILLSGTYLISLLSSFLYFTKESYRTKLEKSSIEKQKNLLELKLKEAQVNLLKEQIHPHFIFNMMNNLYALVNEDSERSREVIMHLSDLLDYMLYECNGDEVELSKEIEFINNYINLEKVRHVSLNITTDFPQNTSSIKIAPLILFPFVENAFKHGLKQAHHDFISINLALSDSSIHFGISNQLHHNTRSKHVHSKGLGLRNVKERLELLYKERHTLDITTEHNIFDVKLEIIR